MTNGQNLLGSRFFERLVICFFDWYSPAILDHVANQIIPQCKLHVSAFDIDASNIQNPDNR